ncbi:MAG: hypothetical protein KAG89_12405 [Fulvimarina manganoxydans]|uniref:hypothetical protein n=1 Tax=Fulvimarina manganoxydans TaxID=937218 RepID=UPI002355B454|nr:hypothetical protein [Fulvimarina manganoxydans]MCK5932961.1 hypothetical protein [Fulvimarina manganoxydans]
MTDCIWIHYSRPRPHWYSLEAAAQAEKTAAWEAIRTDSQASGATPLGRYHVRGQHDFQEVELWRFASAEAAFDHWARLTSAAYNEFFAFSNNVGLSLETDGG